jgi:hypothetical protein
MHAHPTPPRSVRNKNTIRFLAKRPPASGAGPAERQSTQENTTLGSWGRRGPEQPCPKHLISWRRALAKSSEAVSSNPEGPTDRKPVCLTRRPCAHGAMSLAFETASRRRTVETRFASQLSDQGCAPREFAAATCTFAAVLIPGAASLLAASVLPHVKCTSLARQFRPRPGEPPPPPLRGS